MRITEFAEEIAVHLRAPICDHTVLALGQLQNDDKILETSSMIDILNVLGLGHTLICLTKMWFVMFLLDGMGFVLSVGGSAATT